MVVTLGIVGVVLVAEVVGAIVSGSLALLADAGHLLADGCGVSLALLATVLAARPASAERTFGLQRAEILAALINALIAGGVAVVVVIGGLRRLAQQGEIHSELMFIIAVVAVLGNGLSLFLLRSGQRHSLNVRAAYLEVLGDLLGSVMVVAAAIVIMITGYVQADGIASIIIGVVIVPRVWFLLRDVMNVLLEAAPKGVDLADVRRHMLGVPGVVDVHDLHAWTITSGVPVLSAHVVVTGVDTSDCGSESVLDGLHQCLAGHFDIEHSTFQIEPEGHVEHERARHA
jgi:cobalt-zinc-cadmium efflux system protein